MIVPNASWNPDSIPARIDLQARSFFLMRSRTSIVRVDRHRERQDDACDAGQRERRLQVRHGAEEDDQVHDERDDRVDPGALVIEARPR
jgi:hypothetical protein